MKWPKILFYENHVEFYIEVYKNMAMLLLNNAHQGVFA